MSSQIRVLVTGCGGFIGKYLVQRLLQDESNLVYGVDRTAKLEELQQSEFILPSTEERFFPLDLDLTKQKDCLELPEVDFVYHLAAINGTSLFYKIPWDVFYNSSASTLNVIDRYKDSKGLKRFVYTSSSEVYASLVDGNPELCPTPEGVSVGFQDILNSRWSYGGAKLAGEIALLAAGKQLGIPFSIIRYHNVYGPQMGLDHVIPDFISRGKEGRFELYGSENQRSFIYISDAISATLKIATSDAALDHIIHVGTMDMVSMKFLAEKIMSLAKWTGVITEFPAPIGSTLARCPDTTFLNSKVGFLPTVSLSEGLLEVLRADERR
ncbi:MAG: NAD-dependent epimerase/dehydratase family protein [Candidatus Nanopelagicaceae bacterium]|nr:NAD-dependent epimerase/dehydratase family protein [Candidatus Nanopelagicaceae bacterium]